MKALEDGTFLNEETGEVISRDMLSDIMIEDLTYTNREIAKLRKRKDYLETHLSQYARESISESNKTNTVRVAGEKCVAKVEFKNTVKWDMQKLEELRTNVGDDVFKSFFKIGEYKPILKEIKKVEATAGEAAKELLKQISAAKTEVPARDSVTIEKGPSDGDC